MYFGYEGLSKTLQFRRLAETVSGSVVWLGSARQLGDRPRFNAPSGNRAWKSWSVPLYPFIPLNLLFIQASRHWCRAAGVAARSLSIGGAGQSKRTLEDTPTGTMPEVAGAPFVRHAEEVRIDSRNPQQ